MGPSLHRGDRLLFRFIFIVSLSISTLTLTNFRNYAYARLEVSPAPVILTGHNGAGKTNILEAISLLSPGRGIRRAKLGDIDRRDGNNRQPWAVAAELQTPLGEITVGTGRDPAAGEEGDKRIVKIDGKTARGNAALAEVTSMLWLTPQMDQLFLEGQSARRKFIDRLTYGFDATHATRVNAYEQAMRERNRLLFERTRDLHWLDSLEKQMSETGTAIAIARMETIQRLNAGMERAGPAFPKAIMQLNGVVEDRVAKGEAAVTVEAAFMQVLAAARAEDAAAGRALIGIHRSELTVIHNEKNMEAAYCSTGEQKALLLAITLAAARAETLFAARAPILLLDEVIAHLDPQKRHELFEEILSLGLQAWMTGTDKTFFEGMLSKASVFRVENGVIMPSDAAQPVFA